MNLFSKGTVSQFLKFAVVGVVNTGIDWIAFYLLTNLFEVFSGSGEVWAKIIAFSLAVLNSFIMNSLWTFKEEFKEGLGGEDSQSKMQQGSKYFGKFLLVSLIGLLINSITFSIFRFKFGSSKFIGLVFASGAATLWNFLANKLWTYKKNKEASPEERKYNWMAGIILTISALVCIFSLSGDSGITDEVAHIPAGYSYIDRLDFRLNPEHPPLGKAIDAIPLLVMDIKPAYNHWSWDQFNQWENGWQLIYRAGNDADKVLFWTRIPTVFLFIVLGIYLYKFASELFGQKTGIFALILLAFAPNFLAHARYVTTDIAASVAFLTSAYYFYHYYKKPTLSALTFAGIAFGLAQLLKFSAVLLIPIFGIAIIIKAIIDRKENNGFWRGFWKYLKPLLLMFIIGFVVIWFIYLILTWNMSPDIAKQVIAYNLPTEGAAPVRDILNIFAENSLLKPIGHWLLGFVMVFSHTEAGHTAFLLGQFSKMGWWYFFPTAWFFKEPIPVILLSIWGIIYAFAKRTKEKNLIFTLGLFFTTIIVYWGISMRGSLNIGIRHLLPTFSFFYLIIANAIKPILEKSQFTFSKLMVYGLALWLIIESAFAYPSYLAYFNELRFLWGYKKHEILVDSSLDWGQDLKRLANYVEENNIKNIKVDYFGGGIVNYYIPDAVEWHSNYGKTNGWLAISATFYQMSKYFGPLEGKPSYEYLDKLTPKATIGDSILVFHIPAGFK